MADDGFIITADGLEQAEQRNVERTKRLRDLSPAFKFVAAEIEKETDDAFAQSKSPAGEGWPTLAESTRLARKGAKKLEARLNRRTTSGKLTKAAFKGREKFASRGVAITSIGEAKVFGKPLVDTGRMRNSVRVRVHKKYLVFSAVGYMAPHITGSLNQPGRPPKRNPTVFEIAGGNIRPIPRIHDLIVRTLGTYVRTGKVV